MEITEYDDRTSRSYLDSHCIKKKKERTDKKKRNEEIIVGKETEGRRKRTRYDYGIGSERA